MLLNFHSIGFAQIFWLGADTGWSTELESKGHKFYNWNGEERECTALMKELGMNAIRIRVWVDPSDHDNWCGKEDVLKKALRAKELGMEIMIDFHYSDWWADPGKQNIPKAWEKHSYKKMVQDLRAHTIDILTMLKQNGVTPRWVQVGNETSNGMLWSVEMDPQTGWEKKDENGNTIITHTMGHWERNPKQYAGFFKAGYEAVKEVFPDTKVLVHLDNGFDYNLYKKNLDILRSNGAKWDIIGMSLYPYWSMKGGKEPTAMLTIVDCMKNIRRLSNEYGTDCMITETGYEVDEANPWKMEQGREQLTELIRRARTETNGRCLGVFYWEPECRPSQYKLGAFTEDGHPTAIMRAVSLASQEKISYDRPLVKIETTAGDIIVELYNETPKHRDNFLRLADSGEMDSILFHRTIENFMIQAGDPKSKNAPKTSIENPAPELGNDDILTADGKMEISAEIRYPQFFHKRGALAAARESDDVNPELKSGASQFYIVWGKWPATKGRHPYVEMLDYYKGDQQPGTPWLDGGYTVFGQVVSGLEIVDQIQQSKTDSNDRPINDVRIIRMRRL